MILWTASASGADNTFGSSPSIAPMKINLLKILVLKNRAHCGLVLLASLLSIWFAFTPGAAQSKNQKRITALQIGEAGEGARVTVVSDSVLNDYEAFRRGDRFYVRIPLADFTAGKPSLRGDGFEDVQIQKVGDSVVVSFKLQPGASARVDQRSNRLDVIFSAPNRTVRNSRTSGGSNRSASVPIDGIVRSNNSQTVQHRQRDAAGPLPPDSPRTPSATRGRVVTASDSSVPPKQPPATNTREQFTRSGNNRAAGTMGSSTSNSGASSVTVKTGPTSGVSTTPGQTTGISKALSSPTVSRYESSPVATASTPSTSPGQPQVAASTPATPVGSPTVVKSPGLIGSPNGKSRSDLALQWVKANRQTTLIGGLLGLLLVVVLAALLMRRRKRVKNVKGSGKDLVQPKHSADVAMNSPSASAPVDSLASNLAAKDFVNEINTRPIASELNSTAVPVSSPNGGGRNGIQQNPERARLVPVQAGAQSAPVAPGHSWVPPSSLPASTPNAEEEREVFEL